MDTLRSKVVTIYEYERLCYLSQDAVKDEIRLEADCLQRNDEFLSFGQVLSLVSLNSVPLLQNE